MKTWPGRSAVSALALLLAGNASADKVPHDVEFAPFAGVQFGGTVGGWESGSYSIGTGFNFGATLNVAVTPSWSVELLYSRQATELEPSGRSPGPDFDLAVERYMAAIQEEKGAGRVRFFGDFLVGLTRFVPGPAGYEADERFTLGVSLGAKGRLSKHFGTCIVSFRGSGLWQGDVSAGALIQF